MLVGASNFRDIGGMPVQQTRRIRNGVIFRSNSFARLTDGDLAVVDQLGLKTIIDLRTAAERERNPSRWSSPSVQVHASNKADTRSMLAAMFAGEGGDEAEYRQLFTGFFTDLPELYADEYSAMFKAIARADTPLLVNCSAGKDRTGVAILLLATLLGASRDVAMEDYLLSGERLMGDPAFVDMLTGNAVTGFAHLPPEAQRIMLGVHREHGEAALDHVQKEYGSVEAYLVRRLSVPEPDVTRIRDFLVE